MNTLRYTLLSVGLAALLSACGSPLTLSHQDPTIGDLTVLIDGARAGELEPGGRMKVRLESGVHRVMVVSDDGEPAWPYPTGGWRVVLDDRAAITLTTPSSRQRRQQ